MSKRRLGIVTFITIMFVLLFFKNNVVAEEGVCTLSVGQIVDDGNLRYKVTSVKPIVEGEHTYAGKVKVIGRTKSKGRYDKYINIYYFYRKGINEEYLVTSIDNKAFKNDKYAQTLWIESSSYLTTIGNGAFQNCKNLSSVYIRADSALTTIKSSAFANCKKLDWVNIESLKLTTIEKNAFAKCGTANNSNHLSVNMPTKKLKSVEKNAFPQYTLFSVYKPLIKKYTKILKKSGLKNPHVYVGWTKDTWKSDFYKYE